jgi:thiamine-phosphate pyrophosphorylase
VKPTPLPVGLYAITDSTLLAHRGIDYAVGAALRGGARTIQYRDKDSDPGVREGEASRIAALCREFDATFVVNDDVELAMCAGADGVHLGRDDRSYEDVRMEFGDQLIVGVSCYDSIERAREAQAAGVDYVAFGSAFPSPTKPDAVRAPVSLYRQAAMQLDLPVVAIGGIDASNGGELVAAGCHALAVINALFSAPDIECAASELASLFQADGRRWNACHADYPRIRRKPHDTF